MKLQEIAKEIAEQRASHLYIPAQHELKSLGLESQSEFEMLEFAKQVEALHPKYKKMQLEQKIILAKEIYLHVKELEFQSIGIEMPEKAGEPGLAELDRIVRKYQQ